MRKLYQLWLPIFLACLMAAVADAQSFRVQCPASTAYTHPAATNDSDPAYTGPTQFTCSVAGGCTPTNNVGFLVPSSSVNGAIRCQQVSGGDGYSTMADGTQTFMFSFGPLSGLADIAAGKPGTQFPSVFMSPYTGILAPGDPATADGATDYNSANTAALYQAGNSTFTWNGAVGLAPDSDAIAAGTCAKPCIDGHVDPRQIEDVGVMNGNIPAPLMAINEDDEFFLTLTNVGMIMRPDLFEQHTIHFHGYPNASSFYDGVPDASVAINIGGSFTSITSLLTRALTSGIATSLPQSTFRWAWSDSCMCVPGRTGFPQGSLCSRHLDIRTALAAELRICARFAIPPSISCAAPTRRQ